MRFPPLRSLRPKKRHPDMGPGLFEHAIITHPEMNRQLAMKGDDRGAGKRSRGGAFSLPRQRLIEIERLLAARGGARDAKEAMAFLQCAAPHIAALVDDARARGNEMPNAVVTWALRFVPSAAEDGVVDPIMTIEREHFERPRRLKADTIARMLKVTKAERNALGLTTIGATDLNKAQRAKERKARAKERAKARRIANGATPRERSLARSQPWKALGIGKTKYYALRNQGLPRTNSCAMSEGPKPAPRTNSCAPKVRSTYLETKRFAPTQTDLFDKRSSAERVPQEFDAYLQGTIPETIRVAVLEAKRRGALRQDQIAQAIGVSRPTLANALQGRFGLSPEAAGRLKAWLHQIHQEAA